MPVTAFDDDSDWFPYFPNGAPRPGQPLQLPGATAPADVGATFAGVPFAGMPGMGMITQPTTPRGLTLNGNPDYRPGDPAYWKNPGFRIGSPIRIDGQTLRDWLPSIGFHPGDVFANWRSSPGEATIKIGGGGNLPPANSAQFGGDTGGLAVDMPAPPAPAPAPAFTPPPHPATREPGYGAAGYAMAPYQPRSPAATSTAKPAAPAGGSTKPAPTATPPAGAQGPARTPGKANLGYGTPTDRFVQIDRPNMPAAGGSKGGPAQMTALNLAGLFGGQAQPAATPAAPAASSPGPLAGGNVPLPPVMPADVAEARRRAAFARMTSPYLYT